jgi:hypothetical protein
MSENGTMSPVTCARLLAIRRGEVETGEKLKKLAGDVKKARKSMKDAEKKRDEALDEGGEHTPDAVKHHKTYRRRLGVLNKHLTERKRLNKLCKEADRAKAMILDDAQQGEGLFDKMRLESNDGEAFRTVPIADLILDDPELARTLQSFDMGQVGEYVDQRAAGKLKQHVRDKELSKDQLRDLDDRIEDLRAVTDSIAAGIASDETLIPGTAETPKKKRGRKRTPKPAAK